MEAALRRPQQQMNLIMDYVLYKNCIRVDIGLQIALDLDASTISSIDLVLTGFAVVVAVVVVVVVAADAAV